MISLQLEPFFSSSPSIWFRNHGTFPGSRTCSFFHPEVVTFIIFDPDSSRLKIPQSSSGVQSDPKWTFPIVFLEHSRQITQEFGFQRVDQFGFVAIAVSCDTIELSLSKRSWTIRHLKAHVMPLNLTLGTVLVFSRTMVQFQDLTGTQGCVINLNTTQSSVKTRKSRINSTRSNPSGITQRGLKPIFSIEMEVITLEGDSKVRKGACYLKFFSVTFCTNPKI